LSGERVEADGVYHTRHLEHRVMRELVLLKNHAFPPCARCSNPVYFDIIRPLRREQLRGALVFDVLPVEDEHAA
jgi:hypothetical protein